MIKITDRDIDSVISFIAENYGMELSHKRTFVEIRVQKYMMQHGFDHYPDCFAYLCADRTGKEMSEFVSALLVNYTSFYREPMHFDFLISTVLPQLSKQLQKEKVIYSWSAACSTGEEPYTLAMIMQDYFNIQKYQWDTQILATDISEYALGKAKEAVYQAESAAGLPANWLNSYFDKDINDSANIKIAPQIRSDVIFRKHNLVGTDFTFKHKFHFIFCRNVMIYFSEDTKRRLLAHLYDVLEDGGYLFVGSSERIAQPTPFVYVKPSIYRKVVNYET